jgi:hypothetical protein
MPEPLTGRRLAESAHAHARIRDPYRSGMLIEDLVRELESRGVRIAGDDPWSTLRSAVNGAQDLWINQGDGRWTWIDQPVATGLEISGKALAEVIYPHVQERYPSERIFHYEEAKEQLLRKGVRIKGPVTGRTMRAALVGSPARFESLGHGMWRWKP